MMRCGRLVGWLIVVACLAPPGAQPQAVVDFTQPLAPVGQSASRSSPSSLKPATTVGERLEYLVSWSDFLVAARVQMDIGASDSLDQGDHFRLQVKVQTVGLVRSLFIAVDDELRSYVDPTSLLPSRFDIKLREGRRRVDSTILFDHKAGSARIDDRKRVTIDSMTRDVVALLFYLRTIDLGSRRPVELTGMYQDNPFTVLVSPERREVVQTPTGPVDGIEIALRTVDGEADARQVKDDYRLRLWLSDDEKRIPLLITAQPPFGSIQVKLVKREVRSVPDASDARDKMSASSVGAPEG